MVVAQGRLKKKEKEKKAGNIGKYHDLKTRAVFKVGVVAGLGDYKSL